MGRQGESRLVLTAGECENTDKGAWGEKEDAAGMEEQKDSEKC